jgi:hypothetical protein
MAYLNISRANLTDLNKLTIDYRRLNMVTLIHPIQCGVGITTSSHAFACHDV